MTKNKQNDLKTPGEKAPPGKYEEVGPKGGKVANPRKTTVKPKETIAPTSKPGNKWRKVK